MNSRFKFIQSVNPQPIPTNAIKPKFSKLTLATSKIVATETVNEQTDRSIQAPQTVACVRTTTTTTTTTTMMKNVLDEASAHDDMDDISCAQQQQKILLYESTRDETQSALLTDDDTNSVNSSLDSKDLESGLKETTQPTQDTVANVDQIDTQMQSLSFISTPGRRNVNEAKNDEGMHNISRQLEQLDILNDDQDAADERQATEIECNSIVSLSSNDTLDRESDQLENTQEENDSDSVIVLSDTDTEEPAGADNSPPKRIISQEPPLKPTMPSSNDPAMYNISPIDTSSMQRVNNFFDNAPFIEPGEPVETVENSFNSSHISTSQKEEIYVPETTDEESMADDSISAASFHEETDQIEKENTEPNQQQLQLHQQQQVDADADVNEAHEAHETRKTDFSDNNIIVDIPVKKSASDQPRQLIRSQSGVRLTASRSSPITKTSSGKIDSDGVKRSSSNVILKTPGNCGITVNSSNGQLNIAAKININIKIVEDSSEESSEDNNKPARKSPVIQSSEDCPSSRNTNTNSNDINSESPKPAQSANQQNDSKNNRTPVKKTKTNAVNKTPKTPQTATKLKQFEFVPPKSISKPQKTTDGNNRKENENDGKPLNKSITSESSENDGFQIDKSIPISPRDQKLLHKVYGDAWKTPDVIRSYSAVKGKKAEHRAAANTTPSVLKNRYSKGFDLFKQKLQTNLNSTTLDEHAEISIIETPKRLHKFKSPQKGMKPPQNTPRTNYKTAPNERDLFNHEPSPSVLTKKKQSPKSNKKNFVTPKTGIAASPAKSSRPQRSVQRKRIIYSDDDDSDKENPESDWSDDSNYTCSNSESELLTDDNSDEEKDSVGEPKSVRGKKALTGSTTKKRPNKKTSKNGLIYLDLSSEEIVQVDENFHANVSEADLANITRKFLEADLNDDVKPKKKTGRKLFTHKYDEADEENETNYDSEPKSVKKKPAEEVELNVEIPRFTHKLFDSKNFGSPSTAKTPAKNDIKIDEFKTPSISRILGERKTPFNSAKSKLDSPPKTFTTYSFLKSLDVQSSMMLCHPDAKKFRENFKAHKEELTTILYKLFNEKVFENKLDVDIIWNKKLTTTAGRFHGQKKAAKLAGKNHRVELSEKVLTSADRLRCTLIHELCHAATWSLNGEASGHGACWKGYARKANHIFPELPLITVCHDYDIQYKYTYKCDMCHHKSQSHSKSKKVENIRCSYCHGMISIFLNKKTKDGKIVMEPVREAKGFAKFVKEKYKEFKKPGVKHADVMRQISSQYSTLSQEEKEKY